jgi:hypothetical protein
MNSLKQFLSLAVQNAEKPPDVILYSIIAAGVVFTLVAFGIMCWLRWKIQKKRYPNLTAGQFWRDLIMTDNPNS